MSEYAGLTKTYKHGGENLSKVNNTGIRLGRRQCSRPLNNDFAKPETRRKTSSEANNPLRAI